jgi:hypothetical protein
MSAEGWQSVETWLLKNPASKKVNRSIFNRFMVWLKVNGGPFKNFTPEQLLYYQDKAVGRQRFDIVKVIEFWVLSQQGRIGYKKKMFATIKSFFLHNECSLPAHPFNAQANTTKMVEGTLQPEEIRAIVLKTNKLYRAVFLSMLGGGMGEDEIVYWSNNGLKSLQNQIANGEKIIEINLPGRKLNKNIKPYYSLLAGDAFEAVKAYLAIRPKVDSDAIFINQYNLPLTKTALYQVWTQNAKKLGIIEAKNYDEEFTTIRYGKNPHEIRDVFRTLTGKTKADKSILEFLMGHFTDKNGYDKAYRDHDWVKSEYALALKSLNILTGTEAYGLVKKLEFEEKYEKRINENDEVIKQQHIKIEDLTKTVNNLIIALSNRNSLDADDLRILAQQMKESEILVEERLQAQDRDIAKTQENIEEKDAKEKIGDEGQEQTGG